MTLLHKIFAWSLDIIFPKNCLGCGQENFYICGDCFTKIPVQKTTKCFVCERRSPAGHTCQKCRKKNSSALNGLLVASDWNNLLLRQSIYAYKYNFIKELAQPLAQIMISSLKAINFKNLKNTKRAAGELILIPVPLHKRRLLWRDFNQAELLTRKIGEYFQIPIGDKILKRSRNTLPQADIKEKSRRQKNIKGAFGLADKINRRLVHQKTIILVDDISTTASTLQECAKALKPLEPKEIWGLVLARG